MPSTCQTISSDGATLVGQRTLFSQRELTAACRPAQRRHRRDDRVTSVVAANDAETSASRHKAAILRVADEYPRTANELALLVMRGPERWNQETLRKRVRELCEDDGLLKEAGVKVCEFSGKKATAFRKVQKVKR